jgi:HEAT repeat protein
MNAHTQPSLKDLTRQLQKSAASQDRKEAAQSLGMFGAQAVEPLCRALADASPDVRAAAVASLGEIGDARAVAPICRAMEDSSPLVQQRAKEALGNLCASGAVWQALESVKVSAPVWLTKALSNLGAPAVEPLCRALTLHRASNVRGRAAEILGTIGDARAVEFLCRALTDRAVAVRAAAAEALGRIGDERAIDPLRHATEDADETVRVRASIALQQFGAEGFKKSLIASLKVKNPSARAAAARQLGQLKAPDAVLPLCAALKDKDIEVRVAAAEALGNIGDDRAVQPLIDALRDAFTLRSAWLNFVVGVLLLVGSVLLGGVVMVLLLVVGLSCFLILLALMRDAAFFLGEMVVEFWIHLGALIAKSMSFFRLPRRRDRLCFAIAEALAQIAEQSPTPALRAAIPDLKAVSADVIQQDEKTRTASRRAAHRIRVLTERLKNLPLPASAPEPDAATLPRVADSPKPDVETLPRVE